MCGKLDLCVENLEKSVENLEKKCEKQFQNRPGSLYRPLKQLGENSEVNILELTLYPILGLISSSPVRLRQVRTTLNDSGLMVCSVDNCAPKEAI